MIRISIRNGRKTLFLPGYQGRGIFTEKPENKKAKS